MKNTVKIWKLCIWWQTIGGGGGSRPDEDNVLNSIRENRPDSDFSSAMALVA